MYTSEYPPFYVTADIVVMRRSENFLPRVLLIRRKSDPYKDCWALPGGFVNMDETVEEAACRELREETGLDRAVSDLSLVGVWSEPDRDPRHRIVSTAFFTWGDMFGDRVTAGDDAAEYVWVEIPQIDAWPLAFDHFDIINVAASKIVKGEF